MSTRKLGAAALLATAVIATGCGGDDDDGDSGGSDASAAPPTKAEYIKAADQICRDAIPGRRQFTAAQDKVRPALAEATGDARAPAARRLVEVIEAGLVDIEATNSELEALDPPPDGGAKAYLATRRQLTAGLRKEADATAAYAKDLSQASSDAAGAANQELVALIEKGEKTAEAYGLKVCGQPLD